MRPPQNTIPFGRSFVPSLAGELPQAQSLVKYRQCWKNYCLLFLFASIIGFAYGCTSRSGLPAEISLTRGVMIEDGDFATLTTYANKYSDTDAIWEQVANSIQRDTACNTIAYHFDTVVTVRSREKIKVSFKYTEFPFDSGGKKPAWASSGISYDPIHRGFVCYSIDNDLYSAMLDRIRKTARKHPTKLTQSQTFPIPRKPKNERPNKGENDLDPSDPDLINKILGIK
ncbi:MAG TPA: hypothetical protein PK208_08030 [Fibrobacteria bacterium]|nr:hypothetical protein [Fibrobacteria bacterium]